MKQDKGKFLVDRDVSQRMIRNGQEMCDYGAYIYLLSEAAYADHVINYDGNHITIKRGQVPKSIRVIAHELNWSTGRVQRFLKKLEDAGHIKTSTDTGFTIITFCNYEENQRFYKSNDTSINTPQRTMPQTVSGTKIATNANTNITNITNELKELENKETAKAPKWKELLRKELGSPKYNIWIAPLSYEDGFIICPCETTFNWCNNNYTQKIKFALSACGLEFKGLKRNIPTLKVINGGGG